MRPLLLLKTSLLLLGFASAHATQAAGPATPPLVELRPGDDADAARAMGILDIAPGPPGGFDATLRTYADATLTLDSFAKLTAREPTAATITLASAGDAAFVQAELWSARGPLATLAPGEAATLDVEPGEPVHVRLRLGPHAEGGTFRLTASAPGVAP